MGTVMPGIQHIATEIYKKLKELGLSTWAGGTLIRNSENNTLYPDGSLSDYLSIIRRNKLAGIPAVLIEHAFLSNASDVSRSYLLIIVFVSVELRNLCKASIF